MGEEKSIEEIIKRTRSDVLVKVVDDSNEDTVIIPFGKSNDDLVRVEDYFKKNMAYDLSIEAILGANGSRKLVFNYYLKITR